MEFQQIVQGASLDALLKQVDSARLMLNVENIARNVRTPATPEENETFALLKAEFQKLGLNTKLSFYPAYISLPRSASLVADGKTVFCAAHSMTASVKQRSARLIYLRNEEISSASPGSLNGKYLLTEGLASLSVVEAAAARDAAGVIFITGKYIHEMIVSGIWGSPTPRDLDSYTNLPVVSINAADGLALKELLLKRPLEAVLTTRVENSWTDLPVLTADLPGAEDGYLLLSGHVDSWHHGALDNASGNAAMLEIARIVSQAKNSLRRGIKFIFWSGHSHGRYAGSAAFCDANYIDLWERCFLHVNVDCLGGQNATVLTQGASMAETKALGAAAVKKITGEALEDARFSRSCDQSFWGTGTPSLFSSVSQQQPLLQDDAASAAFTHLFGGGKSGGYGWWWHTEADTPDKLDADNLSRDCRIFLAVVYAACAASYFPFQLQEAAKEISASIETYKTVAGHLIQFEPLLDDAGALLKSLTELEHRKQFGLLEPHAYNRCAMEIEQILVPLLYVKGSHFAHDAARPQPLLPLLEDCLTLTGEKSPHRRSATRTLITRQINAVRAALRSATKITNSFL